MRILSRWLRTRRRSFVIVLNLVLILIVVRKIQRHLTHNRIKDKCDAYSELIKITTNVSSPYLHVQQNSSRNVFQNHPSWQTFLVNSKRFGDIYLYSAFVYEDVVSFNAMVERNGPYDGLYCVINSGEATVAAVVEEAPEHHDYRLTAAFIRCAAVKLRQYNTVKLVCKGHESGVIAVSSFRKPRTISTNPVICVRPLYGPFKDTNYLIEFLAYYSANDIKNFVFFDESISNRTRLALDNLQGVNVKVLPWNLSPNLSKSVHANGQIVAAHYCLTHFLYDQLILVDIDEFITTPNQDLTLWKYIDNSLTNKPNILAMVIKMTAVCDEMNHLKESVFKYPLKILNNNRRQITAWSYEHRSKLIILKPYKIKFTGVHNTWEYVGDVKRKTQTFYELTEYVDANELLVLHFRTCCIFTQPYIYGLDLDIFHFHTLDDDVVTDNSIRRFESNITAFIDMQQSRI